MQKFIQYTPTEILFGENTQAEVGKEVKKWGGSRVFIVYGGGSVKKSGLLAQIEEALEKEGLAYAEDGYRTGDIMSDGCTKVGTARMGDLICERIR